MKVDVPALAASLRALGVEFPACRPILADAARGLEQLAHDLVEAQASARVLGPRWGSQEPPEP